MMDALYLRLRKEEFNKRLEVSRNFVRILTEHRNFVPQSDGHHIDKAERSALKLREKLEEQRKERDAFQQTQKEADGNTSKDYLSKLSEIKKEFLEAQKLMPQQRGYALEKIFVSLMRISGISVVESFRIEGEQIDGGIKYDGQYYLIEAKWTESKTEPKDLGAFYYKVEGKMGGRGILISMNGYTSTVADAATKGKEIRVLLLDGTHFANVIFGVYQFSELLEHSIKYASLKASIYSPHSLDR